MVQCIGAVEGQRAVVGEGARRIERPGGVAVAEGEDTGADGDGSGVGVGSRQDQATVTGFGEGLAGVARNDPRGGEDVAARDFDGGADADDSDGAVGTKTHVGSGALQGGVIGDTDGIRGAAITDISAGTDAQDALLNVGDAGVAAGLTTEGDGAGTNHGHAAGAGNNIGKGLRTGRAVDRQIGVVRDGARGREGRGVRQPERATGDGGVSGIDDVGAAQRLGTGALFLEGERRDAGSGEAIAQEPGEAEVGTAVHDELSVAYHGVGVAFVVFDHATRGCGDAGHRLGVAIQLEVGLATAGADKGKHGGVHNLLIRTERNGDIVRRACDVANLEVAVNGRVGGAIQDHTGGRPIVRALVYDDGSGEAGTPLDRE